MSQEDLWVIGKITGVHGLKGNLKVWSFAQSVDTFGKGRQVWIKSEQEEQGELFTILHSSVRKKGVLICLEHVDNISLAEKLIGREILISKDQLPEIEKDSWYWQDLYQMTVIDRVLGELGTIDSIFPTNAHDILVVTDKNASGESEILIPIHEHFIESVDLDAKTVFTTLPEGHCS
jgi:16S rRNA processing protein RimM